MRRLLLLVVVPVVLTVSLAEPAHARPIEDYASYQPATRCSPKPKPGTVLLGHWIVHRYGGGFGGISRTCSKGSTSEHEEGRAFDWTVSAARRKDRRRVDRFLRGLFAADEAGHADARARRMGVMYVIWDDRIYSAWREFRPERYKSSGCKRIRTCSPTLRHRDHVHISITRLAARGRTSWYAGR